MWREHARACRVRTLEDALVVAGDTGLANQGLPQPGQSTVKPLPNRQA
jgi:hypothetical protein